MPFHCIVTPEWQFTSSFQYKSSLSLIQTNKRSVALNTDPKPEKARKTNSEKTFLQSLSWYYQLHWEGSKTKYNRSISTFHLGRVFWKSQKKLKYKRNKSLVLTMWPCCQKKKPNNNKTLKLSKAKGCSQLSMEYWVWTDASFKKKITCYSFTLKNGLILQQKRVGLWVAQ